MEHHRQGGAQRRYGKQDEHGADMQACEARFKGNSGCWEVGGGMLAVWMVGMGPWDVPLSAAAARERQGTGEHGGMPTDRMDSWRSLGKQGCRGYGRQDRQAGQAGRQAGCHAQPEAMHCRPSPRLYPSSASALQSSCLAASTLPSSTASSAAQQREGASRVLNMAAEGRLRGGC